MKVHLVPIMDDNYVFVLENDQKESIVVDPGEAAPVLEFLRQNQLRLKGVLVTHHHHDHVGGVDQIARELHAPVWVPIKDRDRWPWPDQTSVSDGEKVQLAGFCFRVIALPGHTLDHVAYYEEAQGWLFSGDVLFGLGCGRLFEGTPAQMHESLNRLKVLPQTTLVYCTHEYTRTNLAFVKSIGFAPPPLKEYETRILHARQHGEPTVPLLLKDELACNPLLNAGDLKTFTERRELRNHFRTSL